MKTMLSILAVTAIGSAFALASATASSSVDDQLFGPKHPEQSQALLRLEYQGQCGTFALARILSQSGASDKVSLVGQLMSVRPPPGGFSLGDLTDLSAHFGGEFVAVKCARDAQLPVPSVIHCRQGHFIAVTARAGECFEVWDARRPDGPQWRTQSQIDEESSGFFLCSASALGFGVLPLSGAEGASVRGGECNYTDLCDDLDTDCDADEEADNLAVDSDSPIEQEINPLCRPSACSTGEEADSPCAGMPVWRVSEPYLNIWIKDKPLFYTMSNGRQMALKLTWNRRNTDSEADNVSSFGNHWKCSWLTYVKCTNGDLTLGMPGGGKRIYLQSTNAFAWNREALKMSYASMSSDGTISQSLPLNISFRSGSTNSYSYKFTPNSSSCPDWFLLSAKTDHAGRKMAFNYETVNGVARLANVVDFDGKSVYLYYTNTAPQLVRCVKDPYERKAYFYYDDSNNLTNITDMQGISTGFTYNDDGSLATMVTPYGTTVFEESVGFGVDRAVRVTLPNGTGHEMFAYQGDTSFLDDTYSDCPTGHVAVINSGMANLNSFHWTPKQYDGISTNSWPDFTVFTTNDFLKARLKHWLPEMVTTNFVQTLPMALSLIRMASPDGVADGQKIWYTYLNQSVTNRGDNPYPIQVALKLPDGSSRYTYLERTNNVWALPTRVISTYSVGTNVQERTSTFSFSADGLNLLTHTDELGKIQGTFTYTNRQVATFSNASNEVTSFTYNAANKNIASIQFPAGLLSINYAYTNGAYSGWLLNRVAQTTNASALFSTNTFTYSGGKVATQTDARGLAVANYWDDLQRLTGRSFPDQTGTSNRYDRVDGTKLLDLTASKDRKGNWTYFDYNPLRQLTTITNARSKTTVFTYCSCGALESIHDALANVFSFAYDNLGRLTNYTYPSFPGTQVANNYTYNSLGQLIAASVADLRQIPNRVTNTFNNQGLLIASSNAWGRVRQIGYDVKDRPVTLLDAASNLVSVTYDNLSRLRTRSFADGGVEGFGYSANVFGPTRYTNQITTNITLAAYDALGRLTNVVFQNYATNRFTYSPAGDLTSLIDGKGQTSTWIYDAEGRLTNRTDSAGSMRYSYHPTGWLSNRVDALARSTTYAYDAVGNPTTITYPTRTATFTFDAVNRILLAQDQITDSFTFQDAGIVYDDTSAWSGSTAVAFEVRPGIMNWEQVKWSDSNWSWVSFYFDGADRFSQVQPGETPDWFTYAYAANRGPLLEKLTLPHSLYITNSYDTVGRLTRTALMTNATVLNSHDYGYNAAWQRTSQTRADGSVVTYIYDTVGQLIGATAKHGTTNRLNEQFGYGYDPAGNLSKRTNNVALVQTFLTDGANRLTNVATTGTITVAGTTTSPATDVTVNGSAAQRYADSTFAASGQSITSSYTAVAHDSLGRGDTNTISINLPASVTLQFDANGNLLSDGRRTFAWDEENRLTSVIVTNGVNNSTKSEFVYDAFGRKRLTREYLWGNSQWLAAGETRYLYNGWRVRQERDQFNLRTVTYVWGADLSGSLEGAGGIGGLLARVDHRTGSTAYYHTDGNGNITAMVNERGIVVARYLYDPFGNIISKSGPLADANVYRFSSKEYHDKSGLYYFGFRWYDPNLQRFINRDPIGELGGINLYGFVGNNPISRVDPFGLDFSHWYGDDTTIFYPSGSVPYLTGDAWWENLVSGAYNTIPLINNTLGRLFSPINALIGGLGSGATQLSGDPAVGQGVENLAMLGLLLTDCPAAAERQLFRGGSCLVPRRGIDYKVGPNGLVNERGISLNANKLDKNIQKYGGAFELDQASIPEGLKIKPTSGTHYELVPSRPMTESDYLELMKQVKILPFIRL